MTPRRYRSEDQTAVIELWRACDLTRPWNNPADDIRLCEASAAAQLFVVTAGQESVAGTIMVGADGHRGWLYYLAVAAPLRRRGVGRGLLATAEDWLRAQGITKAMLMIRPENAAVRDFYTALGYADEPRLVLARWLDGRPTQAP